MKKCSLLSPRAFNFEFPAACRGDASIKRLLPYHRRSEASRRDTLQQAAGRVHYYMGIW